MPSGSTVTFNNYKKIQEDSLNGRIVVQPHVWYTCPADKKAIVKGNTVCTSTGAATIVTLRGAAEVIARWDGVAGGANPWDRPAAVNVIIPIDVELDAGETIESSQDSGTNAAIELIAKIEETPV